MSLLHWFEKGSSAQHVVVACHGMNNTPQSFFPLAQNLATENRAIVLVGLTGHNGDTAAVRNIEAQTWIDDLASGFLAAKERYPNAGISSLTFSLSSAVFLSLLTNIDLSLRSIVLLAPAILPRGKLVLVKPFLPLRHFGIRLPSPARKEFRAWSWTPLQAYCTLHDLTMRAQHLETHHPARRLPVHVCIDPADELVSAQAIHDWKEKEQLEHWQIHDVERHVLPTRTFHHEIFHPLSFSAHDWETHLRNIDFLLGA